MSNAYYTYRIRLANYGSVKVEKRDLNNQSLGDPEGKFGYANELRQTIDKLVIEAQADALTDDEPVKALGEALFDALSGAGDLVPRDQGDGVITAQELSSYLQDTVSRLAEEQASHEQMPQLWPLNKHQKGEYIFLAPGHPLNLPPASVWRYCPAG